MSNGRITLGPQSVGYPGQAAQMSMLQQAQCNLGTATVQACNCIGPQRGETKCPCMLRAEMDQAHAMLRHGVMIGDKHYRLVPA